MLVMNLAGPSIGILISSFRSDDGDDGDDGEIPLGIVAIPLSKCIFQSAMRHWRICGLSTSK